MGSTPIYGLPFLDLGDPPDIAGDGEDSMTAVENLLQADLVLGDGLEVPGTVEFSSSVMRPDSAESDTDIIGYNSVTPVPGSTVVGLAFVAPPSGMVWVSVRGRIRSNTNGNLAILSWELLTGSTIGSGSSVVTVSTNRGIIAGASVVASGPNENSATNRSLVTGLTPGNNYNVRCMHYVSVAAALGDFLYRSIAYEPVF